MVSASNTGTIGGLSLTADSRGLLMMLVKKRTDGSILATGLLAVHGADLVTKLAGDLVGDQPGSGTYNVYFDTLDLVIQNTSSTSIEVTVTYFGV